MAGGAAESVVTGTPQMSAFARIKAILGGSAGNLVEWYDWFAYSSTSLYFAAQFFPKGDATAQQLQTAAVFAAGFIARPAGAWLMGIYADRAGRRAALTLSVALMSLGSFAIAILPTFAQIGVLAQLGLLAARLVQGLSLGGEYGASATYMSEMAGAKRRGFWSSFQYTSLIGGQVVALFVLVILQHVLSKADLAAWGWRIPFAIGGLLAIVVFWIRTGLDETQAYLSRPPPSRARPHRSTLILKTHPREFAIVLVLTAAGSLGTFYAYTTYMQKFLVQHGGLLEGHPARRSAWPRCSGALYAAAAADRLALRPRRPQDGDRRRPGPGRARHLSGDDRHQPRDLGAGRFRPGDDPGRLPLGLFSAVSAVVKAELFPAHVRALEASSLPYALANAMFRRHGGICRRVAEAGLKGESGFYVYVAAVMLVGASRRGVPPAQHQRHQA